MRACALRGLQPKSVTKVTVDYYSTSFFSVCVILEIVAGQRRIFNVVERVNEPLLSPDTYLITRPCLFSYRSSESTPYSKLQVSYNCMTLIRNQNNLRLFQEGREEVLPGFVILRKLFEILFQIHEKGSIASLLSFSNIQLIDHIKTLRFQENPYKFSSIVFHTFPRHFFTNYLKSI